MQEKVLCIGLCTAAEGKERYKSLPYGIMPNEFDSLAAHGLQTTTKGEEGKMRDPSRKVSGSIHMTPLTYWKQKKKDEASNAGKKRKVTGIGSIVSSVSSSIVNAFSF